MSKTGQQPSENTTDTTAGATMTLDQKWSFIQTALKTELGNTAYNNWIHPLTIKDLNGKTLEIAVPTRFIGNWIKSHYGDRIRSLWSNEFEAILCIDCIVVTAPVQKPSSSADTDNAPSLPKKVEAPNILSKETPKTTLDHLSSHLDPRFTFDNFIVGKPNELAHAAARRVAESDEPSFNPLFLYGGVGLGKTHLMHAIAWAIREKNPDRKVIYLSAEKFMYQFIRALRFKDTVAFKEQFRSVDVLMIDDVQFIGGKDSTQEEFFHTFNALVDQNRQIILSADKSPSDLEGVEERLRSRLGWGLVADIHPTNYELRLGILEAKRAQLNQDIPQNVMEFLAHKITSNVRELEGALNRIAAHADLIGRAVTIENTQDVLRDLLRANDRRVTIDDIQRKVSEHYNIRVSDMHSARRARNVARPRQVAMYLAKQLTDHSLPEIGRKFGGRDHTTIMHGVRKIEELLTQDREISENVALLKRALSH